MDLVVQVGKLSRMFWGLVALSMHRGLKNRLKQYLLLRGSNDFESATTYEMWLWRMLLKTNRPRQTKLGEELAVMRPVTMARLPEFTEVDTRVSSWSTISIKSNVYSVPSRLIGEKVMRPISSTGRRM